MTQSITKDSIRTYKGHPQPFGSTQAHDGVNFAIFSKHASSVHLCLYEAGHKEPFCELILDPQHNKTGDVWHILVSGLSETVQYAYRVNGPYAPKHGHYFNPKQVVQDPYALANDLQHSSWSDHVESW